MKGIKILCFHEVLHPPFEDLALLIWTKHFISSKQNVCPCSSTISARNLQCAKKISSHIWNWVKTVHALAHHQRWIYLRLCSQRIFCHFSKNASITALTLNRIITSNESIFCWFFPLLILLCVFAWRWWVIVKRLTWW